MQDQFFKDFFEKARLEKEKSDAEKKRKNHFQEIGRKGGLKKKSLPKLEKIVAVRYTESEFEKLQKEAENYQLKISKYIRLLSTNSTLKVNEFKQDETLLSYATHFKRIKNLLRNAEWNVFENKKQILENIDWVLMKILEYLNTKNQSSNFNNKKDE